MDGEISNNLQSVEKVPARRRGDTENRLEFNNLSAPLRKRSGSHCEDIGKNLFHTDELSDHVADFISNIVQILRLLNIGHDVVIIGIEGLPNIFHELLGFFF